MTKKETIAKFVSEAKITVAWGPDMPRIPGGQACGTPTGVILDSEEWGFRIYIGATRSYFGNLRLAKTLFELYLEEVIQPHTYYYE